MQHLVGRWGTNANGGLRYYTSTTSRASGTGHIATPHGADDGRNPGKMLDYAGKIKAVDPSALIVGPGGAGAATSTAVTTSNTAAPMVGAPARSERHGGADYLPWLLDALRQNNTATGVRLLDVFTVHYYPQGSSDDVSSAMQLRRNRSTRSLWDPAYVDETWINDRSAGAVSRAG